MKMTLAEMVDEVMIRTGQPMTVYAIAGAVRETFNERVDLVSLFDALGHEQFARTGYRAYGLNHTKRADRLAESFGL